MRLKDLFTIPAGQKITERALHRVLIVSICGILLSMSCLAATTWAWYIVDIENTENEICISSPEVMVTINGATAATDGTTLGAGTHPVKITHANEADALNNKSTLYVTLIVQCNDRVISMYTKLGGETDEVSEVTIVNESGGDCQVTWTVSWIIPRGMGVEELTTGAIILSPVGASADETEETTEATGNTTETTMAPTEDTEATTETTVAAEVDTTEADPEENDDSGEEGNSGGNTEDTEN